MILGHLPTGSFRERLNAAAQAHQSWLCVGLDPDPSLAPAGTELADWLSQFLGGIVEATADLVCCYKPNLAFFEALGPIGMDVLRRTREAIPSDIPTLGDAKRGDTPHTMRAYATALFDQLGFDAVTVSPYLGGDALQPFFAYLDRGVFVLCKTSSPGSGELQDLTVQASDGTREPIYRYIARRALTWDRHGTLGLVVGATYPADVAAVREVAPRVPILLPGVGAQGGDLEAAVQAGIDANGGGIIVNASRSIVYASLGPDWQSRAREEAQRLRIAIQAATGARRQTSDNRRLAPGTV